MAQKFRSTITGKEVEAVQLTWANWSQVCDFVPRPYFGTGVWLDANRNVAFGNNLSWQDAGSGNNLGLFINIAPGRPYSLLARGNDWIVKIPDRFVVVSPESFEQNYKEIKHPLWELMAKPIKSDAEMVAIAGVIDYSTGRGSANTPEGCFDALLASYRRLNECVK